ncbi:type I-MYXAN CRISPR-associated endonuclease Cas4/Cas1 [Leptodesmis sichuanensis]|uniref:type I-MYXAN CRISPR-associated endonuclease Cas4/Cas1 n=1 Tax=Leptodesmis sichuanensis TaxID=2906798 RepID=UPI001F1A7A1D|nr:type I-MYXAN CRISPR-associated endonuclease Cas1 [Leptodesmis sichuanensis]UIE36491.1 type I-MYXAN CRISPR-associated endonuclease Cas1 [Leptodesmis sichuanensis A121]
MNTTTTPAQEQDTLRVNALHALAYCPRLFYLEEVEELYTQDASVFAGRRLHVEIEKDEEDEWQELILENSELGLRGRVDALRTRSGQTIPYEHKRGQCYRDRTNKPQAWESDRLQILAYACLIEAALGITVLEGRIRYHADNVLVHVPLDAQGRQEVREAIEQARQLRLTTERPPITTNERLCARCSLAPVCLPEEVRLAQGVTEQPIRLFPEDDEREVIHVLEAGTSVGKNGEQLKITKRDKSTQALPARQVGQLVLHSFAQISTQALYFCAEQEIGVHFISGGGRYLGSFEPRAGSIQRRVRQYQALSQPDTCLQLARQLVICRGQSQRKFLMRGQRGSETLPELESAIAQMQRILKQVPQAESLASLLGLEGNLAALYFKALPQLLSPGVAPEFQFSGRNRRPPQDRFNALLSFGYSLLLKDVMNAILVVGLEPALGFYHQPRTQAPPLALDLMEIFRVPLVDLPVMGSINRGQWEAQADFEIRGGQVWLSESGRRKFISLYERRKEESWKHPVLNYSLTYRRLLELEVRLLEKEWMGEGGLFGQLVIR